MAVIVIVTNIVIMMVRSLWSGIMLHRILLYRDVLSCVVMRLSGHVILSDIGVFLGL